MSTPAAVARTLRHRAKRLAAGGRLITVMLDPQALADMTALMATDGTSAAETVRRALSMAARSTRPTGA